MCKAKRFWVTTRKLLSGQNNTVAHIALVAVAVYKILTHDHGTKFFPGWRRDHRVPLLVKELLTTEDCCERKRFPQRKQLCPCKTVHASVCRYTHVVTYVRMHKILSTIVIHAIQIFSSILQLIRAWAPEDT